MTVDTHLIWDELPSGTLLEQEWDQYLNKEAAKCTSNNKDLPRVIRNLLDNLGYQSQINWRNALCDFIQLTHQCYDYTFSPADRRYTNSEFIMPAFCQIETEKVNNIWFLVDASGSIDDETLQMLFGEIAAAIEQFASSLSGKLSFFDTRVTEPIEFDSIDSLKQQVKPQGGGGTSFACIFEYMQTEMVEKLPAAVIILTDGYASFPKQKATIGVPVLWILTDKNITPPWGKALYI